MGQWMMLVLSRRYSTLPAFTSFTALATSGVTVPALGEGIRPLGPSSLPRRPTTPIMSGEATTTSKPNQFSFWIFSTISISPTKSAPASRAASALSPLANTRTRAVLPVPLGRTIAPRTCWSAWRESTPSFTCSSTVSSNLADAVLQTRSRPSLGSYRVPRSICLALSLYFLPLNISYTLLIRPRRRPWSGRCRRSCSWRLPGKQRSDRASSARRSSGRRPWRWWPPWSCWAHRSRTRCCTPS